jgi:O-methyltransferase
MGTFTNTSPSTTRLGIPGAAHLYLRLLKRCLVRDLFPDQRYDSGDVEHPVAYSRELRQEGKDWPTEAETMVGMKRLDNLQECCLTTLVDSVAGDFVETGVWRGGCGILMRAILDACGDDQRRVWLFDSFEGLPRPDFQSFPKDRDDSLWTFSAYLGVSLSQVKDNFRRYELLDERTHFVKGWFRDTIPFADVDAISVLRLDGDMYESTWIVLNHLYPKLQAGGFVIIDDYGAIPGCKAAVDDFRERYAIRSPTVAVDWTGIYWRV